MLNLKKSYLQINPANPQFFVYDLVSGKGPPCVVKFWKELIGALIGDLDALKSQKFIRVFLLLLKYFLLGYIFAQIKKKGRKFSSLL